MCIRDSGGIKLFVKSEDFEKAQLVLSDVSQYSLNENNQLIKCPKCNAEQVEMVTSIKDIRSFLAFLFSVLVVYMPVSYTHLDVYKRQMLMWVFLVRYHNATISFFMMNYATLLFVMEFK